MKIFANRRDDAPEVKPAAPFNVRFYRLIALFMALISLTACASCTTRDDSPLPDDTGEIEPAPSPAPAPGDDGDNNDDNDYSDMDYSKFPLSEGKNGQAPTIRLSSGYDMPIVGLGTYSLAGDVCVNSVKEAIKAGFRKIDTAYMYGNEAEVGQGVRESGVPRDEIFVATKIYPTQYDDPEAAIEGCLSRLDIGYVDLMLLHHPGSNDVKAYKAMEKYVREGKIRSIGVSCYYIREIDDFVRKVDIKPVLVQNEIHPYYQDLEVVPHIQSLGIAVEAWYPLGGRGHQKELLSDPVLTKIARAHGKSVAQVILRWDLQRGVVVIPGSSNPDHMRENISIFDFELTPQEMSEIEALNRNEKHDWY